VNRFRDIKRKARRDRHRELSVPALYIAAPTATPVDCTVRLWMKTDEMFGATEQKGSAQMASSEDRIRFYLPEVPAPRRNGVVSVEPGEAYRIDFLYPVDDQFQTARVVRLTAAEAAGLPVPA
jgi:hypothetical protein